MPAKPDDGNELDSDDCTNAPRQRAETVMQVGVEAWMIVRQRRRRLRPPVPARGCGNERIDAGEECDDGNCSMMTAHNSAECSLRDGSADDLLGQKVMKPAMTGPEQRQRHQRLRQEHAAVMAFCGVTYPRSAGIRSLR